MKGKPIESSGSSFDALRAVARSVLSLSKEDVQRIKAETKPQKKVVRKPT